MYLPVKPIFKIMYRPRAALEELEVSKNFGISDSLIIYVVLGVLNWILLIKNEYLWLSYEFVLLIMVFSFPLNVLIVYSLDFSANYLFKKRINPMLLLYFSISVQIIGTVFSLGYFIISLTVGKNALLLSILMSFASLIIFLIVLLGISELSGLGFIDSALTYLFSYLVILGVILTVIGAAAGPLVILNLVFGSFSF